MRKAIEKVSKGEIILDGRSEIKVEKIEPYCCSSLGTHINNRYCYDRGSMVRTKNGVAPDKEELALGDDEFDLVNAIFGMFDAVEEIIR
jgi:hypothetical protein